MWRYALSRACGPSSPACGRGDNCDRVWEGPERAERGGGNQSVQRGVARSGDRPQQMGETGHSGARGGETLLEDHRQLRIEPGTDAMRDR